jgi:hypothetical protein
MDERRPGDDTIHLDVEQIGFAADAAQALGERERAHLGLCAVCRAEVERARQVSRMVAELGEAYREAAPPEWPAVSAIEALAREASRRRSWAERMRELLGVRPGSWATKVAVGVGVALALAVVVFAVRPRPQEPSDAGRTVATVPGAPNVPGVPPGPGTHVAVPAPQVVPPVGPLPLPVPVAAHEKRSSVVAVAAGRDVSYVMMNVPYEGGTAAVLWLSALPAAVDEGPDRPL